MLWMYTGTWDFWEQDFHWNPEAFHDFFSLLWAV